MSAPRFIPALRLHALTPLYDAACRAMGLGDALRRWEVDLVEGRPRRVLEVGCGTAELLLALGRRFVNADLVGLDADPAILERAERKLERAGVRARLVCARAELLPLPRGHFDAVVSSLMLHHLDTDTKLAALREWGRVLAPGGSIWLFDFGDPRSRLWKALLWPLRFFEEVDDNLRGRVPSLLRRAGLVFEEVGVYRSMLVAYRARPITA